MNVPQYVLVKVQLVIWFQSSLSHETLATCTLLRPADCIKERITHKERSTSHFTHKEVGWLSDMSASRLPEYSSLIVSTVNGKVTGDVTSIFCHRVTCLGTDQCCWDGNHMPGSFMNVPQYVLVKVQLVIWFQSSLSHETLATCTLLRPADCIQERIAHKERSTSHFTHEEVGCFSDMSASRLPEYSSLIVSTVNGKPTANVGSIFCHSVTYLGTDQCCWDRNHMPGGFMNVSQYLLGKVCRKIWFQASLSHMHLQLARCCAMQVASKKLFDKRKEELLTSHLNKLGDSLTCLLQDCLNTPHLW